VAFAPASAAGFLHWLLRGDARAISAKDLSQTISFARISLIVGLVFLHYESFPNSRVSPFTGFDPVEHSFATYVNSFVLFFFYSVVPLLSMISGWLFFSFAADPNARPATALAYRIRRRFTSLYLPLVFWNAFFLLLMSALFGLFPGDSLLRELNVDFLTAGWLDYVNAVFAVSAHPIGFQFWFVRDLFLTVLVSPLLWALLRAAPLAGGVALGMAWITGNDLWIFFRTDVLFFFYLGGLIRTRGWLVEIGWRATLTFLALYVAMVALRTAAPALIEEHTALLTAATRAMRLFGVVACWGLFLQIAPTRAGATVARYGGLAFFLHAAHYPLLAEIKILLWPLLPAETDGWMLAHYGASVLVTVAVGLCAAILLARLNPKGFAVLNGGRTALG
jgi:surface polysaccharide O-acyltransferase-like enzyme